MFEKGPFRTCPHCREHLTFGILSVAGDSVTLRCRKCRYSHSEPLPSLNKKVIYLDQLAISEVFKIKAGKRQASAGNEAFWIEAERAITQACLLQQVIFPQSDIHRDETAVYSHASDLTISHEILAGDVEFVDHHEIQINQSLEFAKAYIQRRAYPEPNFDIDEVLEGERNSWLPLLHITVNMDFSGLATLVRTNRDSAAQEFIPLYTAWMEKKPSFDDVLQLELKNTAGAKIGALKAVQERRQSAIATGDLFNLLEGTSRSVVREFNQLRRLFEESGVSQKDSPQEVKKFWEWEGSEFLPDHRISCYLFAAIARKLASGQKKMPSRGMMNDIRAVSAYGPYVDAMFIDNECAAYLSESPLNKDLKMRARIFSQNSGAAFIGYLESIASETPDEIRSFANDFYGLK